MTEFKIKLAGTVFSVAANYDDTKSFCSDFLTDGAPDIAIGISPDDIASERKGTTDGFSDKYLERLALSRKTAEALAGRGVMLFHSSAIMVNGEGFLFAAPSGTGKSTHTALWRKLLGDRAVMINDDKPFIGCVGGEFTVYGSPWNGKHRLGANVSAPIRGICILSRGKTNEIKRISPDEALPYLLRQTYRPADAEMTARLLRSLIKMSQDVPIYKLKCNMDVSAAQTSYEAMKGTKNET